ncbi:MAG TPA: hypothetical protein VK517_05465, partial [Cyclobacteriaceae bacterium]|nr:hypothetical protein [Cyclobacteriaceae bacterium]
MTSALLFILLTLPVCTFSQGIELVVPRYHNADIISMDLSPDGKFIISAGSDQKIFLREASTGNYLREFEDSQIRSIRFLADSKTFLIHTSNGIVIRDIGSHDVRQKIEVNAGWVSTNPNRNEFLVLKDSILSIYRETGSVYQATRTLTTPSRPRSCSYSQGGQKLVINDGLVKIVDLASGRFTTIPLESINPDS